MKVIHHGAEAAGFLIFGSLAIKNHMKMSTYQASAATTFSYALGKIAYLATKNILGKADFSKQVARNGGWIVALGVGAGALNFAVSNMKSQPYKTNTVFKSLIVTLGVTAASIVTRTLVNKLVSFVKM